MWRFPFNFALVLFNLCNILLPVRISMTTCCKNPQDLSNLLPVWISLIKHQCPDAYVCKKCPLLFHNGLSFLNGGYETLHQSFTARHTFLLIRPLCLIPVWLWDGNGLPPVPADPTGIWQSREAAGHRATLSSRANLCCPGLKQLFYNNNTYGSLRPQSWSDLTGPLLFSEGD